jgi:hypothetical protein
MSKHLRVITVAALFVFVAATASTSAWIGGGSRRSFVTFNRAVALPGLELRAGTYIFVVRVSSRDRSKVFLTIFTNIIDRPAGLPADRMVTLGEAPRGSAAPVTAWFPSRSGTGYQFVYGR